MTYSHRVHQLSIALEDGLPPSASTKPDRFLPYHVFAIMSHSRPLEELLPNLSLLEFNSNRGGKEFIAPLLLFTGSWLQDLSVGSWPQEVASSLAYIPQRFPALVDFRIRQLRCDAVSLAACVRPLTKLRSLSCYPSALKPVFDAVSEIPCLEFLELYVYSNSIESIIFHPGAFTSLSSLHLRVLLDSCVDLFEGGQAPQALETLHIEGSSANAGGGVSRRILNALPQSLPQLTSLTFIDHSSTLEDVPLKFQDIQAVCSLSLLYRLFIRHACGIDMSTEDLKQVLQGCPDLQYLILSYVPLPTTPQGSPRKLKWSRPSLSLTVLDTVATMCPEMCYLGLCLDAVVPEEQLRDAILDPGPVFFNLSHLEITLSPISDPVSVAEYLASRSQGSFVMVWKKFRAANREEMAEPLKGAEEVWPLANRIVGALHRQSERTEQRLRLQTLDEDSCDARAEVMDVEG